MLPIRAIIACARRAGCGKARFGWAGSRRRHASMSALEGGRGFAAAHGLASSLDLLSGEAFKQRLGAGSLEWLRIIERKRLDAVV